MTTVDLQVRNALRSLALDLKITERAGVLNWASVGRALEAYDLRLEKAGVASDGITKLAGQSDFLAKATKLQQRVDELEKQARPGGPARTATRQQAAAPTLADVYRRQAEQASDPQLRAGYLTLARRVEKSRS